MSAANVRDRAEVALKAAWAFLLLLALAAPVRAQSAPPTAGGPNRTVPSVQPPPASPVFSEAPTDAEISKARVFEEPLVPLGGPGDARENAALAQALRLFLERTEGDDTSAPEIFLQRYPASRWRASLLTNLGIVYRRTGYFTKAIQAWERAWALSKEETGSAGRAMADRAIGELAAINSRLGRVQVLQELLAEVEGRDVGGSASERLVLAREALSHMLTIPEVSFRCGPLGLGRILAATRPGQPNDPRIEAATSTPNGTSLTQMSQLADSVGLAMRMARRGDGEFVTPALIHWKAGHFAALVRQQTGRYLVQDLTFEDEIWITRRALEEEASGYALVFGGSLPAGWDDVPESEGETVWGKGDPGGVDSGATSPEAVKVKKDCKCPEPGMAGYDAHAMLVSLNITDTPMTYPSHRGPGLAMTVTYNQREIAQPQTFSYSNLGPKWTFDWLSYVEDDPGTQGAAVKLYRRGGGIEPYSGYDSGTQSYARQYRTDAVLVLVSSTPVRYERQLPGGAVEVFAQPDGASTFPRKVFLTEVVDAQAKKLTLTYDASLRIAAVQDAVGQVTTLSYELPSDPLKITKVTDPFGRFATFEYESSGRLWRITDSLGMTSSFGYATADFVNAITTPYGTTLFSGGAMPGQILNRYLEIQDPLGGRERIEFVANDFLNSDPLVPTGFSTYNNHLSHPVTYYWDKRAMGLFPGDRTKAKATSWLRLTNAAIVSDVIKTVKMPLENRVWYAYAGSDGVSVGPSASPAAVGRVLDDGTSQVTTSEHNAAGMRIKTIDPVGRETVYVYGANNVPDAVPATGKGTDLLQVKQKNGASYEVVSSTVNNSKRQPTSVTDAAGQVTTYTYTASDEIETVTTPPRAGITEQRTTTYAYEPGSERLQSVTAPGGVTTSYTYDASARLRTVADVDGYILTYDYDNLDRQTRVTYPDGTFEQTLYSGLDPISRRDRLGRWTHTFYDPLRRVVSTRDPEGRVVQQVWCNCGSLDKLIDPNGNATIWERDLQGRVTKETRANGSFKTFVYETTTSRLKSVTDAKGQAIQYAYGVDEKLLSTTYLNAEHPTPNVTLSFLDPQTSAPDAHGRLRSMSDGTGTTSYAYVPFAAGSPLGDGQLASVDGPLAIDTVSYSYDELGRVVSRTLNGVTTTWAYDQQGRLTTLGDPIGTFTWAYVGNTGRAQTVTYPNNQTSTYSYFPVNQDLRPQTIHHKRPNAATLNRFDYTYDAVGNVKTWQQQTDANAAQTYTFEYDRTDQLTAATLAGPMPKRYRYAYDPAGNRTAEQVDDAVGGASYDSMNRLTTQQPGGAILFRGTTNEAAKVTVQSKPAATPDSIAFSGPATVGSGPTDVVVAATDYASTPNTRTNTYRVTETGSTKTYLYDPNGNLCAENGSSCTDVNATKRYEWDGADRLIEVVQGVTTLASFTYGGGGRRATKTAGGVTTTYVYDGSTFLEERVVPGSTKRYLYGPGIDKPLAHIVGPTVTHHVSDHLGSIVRATDSTGSPTLAREYDPWGNPLQGSVTAGYAYTGREWDAETSLYYYRARYYGASHARFLSEDPSDLRGVANRYVYVSNHPTGSTDPSGLVDLNLFSEFEDNDGYRAANYSTFGPQVFSVAGHGNTTGMSDQRGLKFSRDDPAWNEQELKGRFLDAEKLAKLIRQKLGSKCCIYLLACDVGGANFAQRLADELELDVWAPTTRVRFDPTYAMWPGWRPGKSWGIVPPGSWQHFRKK